MKYIYAHFIFAFLVSGSLYAMESRRDDKPIVNRLLECAESLDIIHDLKSLEYQHVDKLAENFAHLTISYNSFKNSKKPTIPVYFKNLEYSQAKLRTNLQKIESLQAAQYEIWKLMSKGIETLRGTKKYKILQPQIEAAYQINNESAENNNVITDIYKKYVNINFYFHNSDVHSFLTQFYNDTLSKEYSQ